jgi:hypothetical protein
VRALQEIALRIADNQVVPGDRANKRACKSSSRQWILPISARVLLVFRSKGFIANLESMHIATLIGGAATTHLPQRMGLKHPEQEHQLAATA